MAFAVGPYEFWLIAVIIGSLGSITFGYLALRYTYPDIRLETRRNKLMYSMIVGLSIFIVSFAISYAADYYYFFIVYPMLVILVSLLIQFRMSARKTVRVAVPLIRTEFSGIKPQAKAAPPGQSGMSRRISLIAGKPKAQAQPARPEIMPQRQPVPAAKAAPNPPAPAPKPAPEPKPSIIDVIKQKLGENKRAAAARKMKRDRSRRLKAEMRPTPPAPIPVRKEIAEQARKSMVSANARPAPPAAPAKSTGQELTLDDIAKISPEIRPDSSLDLSSIETLTADDLSKGSDDTISQLESLSTDLSAIGGVSETQEMPKEKGMSCPKCGKAHSSVVYCPYCGKGFCSNCASSVTRQAGAIIYRCPHCSKEVLVNA